MLLGNIIVFFSFLLFIKIDNYIRFNSYEKKIQPQDFTIQDIDFYVFTQFILFLNNTYFKLSVN